MGLVYLIHLSEPFGHARHYVGYTEDFDGRIWHHRNGTGANLLKHVNAAGITWEVVRTWPGADRNFERRLKAHSSTRNCPTCSGEAAWGRMRGSFEREVSAGIEEVPEVEVV